MQFFTRFTSAGIVALLLASGAHAQNQAGSFSAFSIDKGHEESSNGGAGVPDLTLLSDGAGVTRLGLNRINRSSSAMSGGSLGDYTEYSLAMRLSALPGYQITGLSFSSALTGDLKVETAPAGSWVSYPGSATNGASAYFGVNGVENPANRYSIKDVLGSGSLNVPSYAYSQAGPLSLTLGTLVTARAQRGEYATGPDDSFYSSAYASMQMSDAVLTIYSAALPVPEPETWLMLLGGLVLLPLAARRGNMSKIRLPS